MKILSRAYNFFIFVHTFLWTSSQFFFNFKFSSGTSQCQQKLGKKITHLTIQFCLKNLTQFTNLNSLDIENNMLPKHSQKPFWVYKFSSIYAFVWCQKRHLHCTCTISWRPRTAFLKHFKSKCLYISVYLHKKIFVPKT